MENNEMGHIIETGDSLSVFKAAQIHAKIVEVYSTSDTIEIDLSNVTDCDTAGIQMLYSLKKSSLRDGKNIIIKNISGAVEDAMNRMCVSLKTII
jgi:anti-anti-sigma regulatory factor